MPENPSLDPNRTLDRPPSLEPPSTLDATAAHEPSTDPAVPAPPADAPSIPGYAITAELARGGMGRVYAGRELALDREVAIKTLLPGANAERFVTESKITARLPHPSIPPVHALGYLTDDTPFLAMKLIRGRTLADILARRERERSELLAIFEQIAQAVGFAHRAGIIHRDLKPLNVMVGEFGEVQVMDWGLARHMRNVEFGVRNEDGPDGVAATRSLRSGAREADPEHTAAGAIIGTPGYMAPEQARGEPVDARADVFALGSVLAAILTGKPAFVGTTKRETIDKSASADLADVLARLDDCGADAELIALAKRCLAAEPEARPADGGEVAALVAAYRASVQARLQRAETEKAEALGRSAEVRKRHRQFLIAAAAVSFVLVVGLSVSLWQMNRAIAAEGDATANARQATDNARDSERNALQARDERDAKGRALEAEKAARAAEAAARRQAFAALRNMTEEFVENKFAQGEKLTNEDKAFLRGIIKQWDAFASITGDDMESRAIRAEGRFRVGVVLYNLGNLDESEAAFDESAGLYERLVADFPAEPDLRIGLAGIHNNRAILRQKRGQYPEAAQDYDAAIAINERLVAEYPDRSDIRLLLGTWTMNRGVLRADILKQYPEAERDFTAALAIHQRLAAETPNRFDVRHNLARNHLNLALCFKETKHFAKALTEFDAALDVLLPLVLTFPKHLECRHDLARTYLGRADARRGLNQFPEAELDFAAGIELYRKLAAGFPNRPDLRAGLGEAYSRRALFLQRLGRAEEAEEDYRASLDLFQRLAAEYPDRTEFQYRIALARYNRGTLFQAANRLKDAEEEFLEALRLFEQIKPGAARLDLRRDTANCHANLGPLLANLGRLADGAKHAEAAIALRKQLVDESPERAELSNDLASAILNLAIIRLGQDDLNKARTLLVEARPHHVAALKAEPANPEYRASYRNHLGLAIMVHAGLLEIDEAIRVADLRRDVGWRAPADAYDAAWFLARGIAVARSRDNLDEAKRDEAIDKLGAAAVRMLRHAKDKGFDDVTRLKKDPALAPIRGRDDFKKLVAELDEKDDPT